MADTFSKVQRSAVMSCIRSRGNENTEVALVSLLRRNRIIGWRRNQSVFGKSDFLFKRQKLAVFVDGCFWHGCPKCYRVPKSNRQFWRRKFMRNRKRDLVVNRLLRSQGWKVVRFWECRLRAEKQIVDRLKKALR
jgi:DNA mismatch endonuclease (patch repair protein)